VGKNVAVFVDVANIFYAAKAAGVDIDYVTLLKSATAGRDLVRAYAYTGLDPDNENQRNFHDFLRRSNYKVVSKDIRKYGDGKVKANLDIELVVDMMKTARNLDIAIVVSGDGDFAPAIRAVQEMGVRCEVISFRGNTSSDLIEVADLFTDIVQLARVEKGSRSGRRVSDDGEDLSMTEVPDKQTEGTGAGRGRGRGRGRSRPGEPEPVAASSRSRGRARPVAAVAAASSGADSGLVALPGERLSRLPGSLTEADLAAAEVFTLDDDGEVLEIPASAGDEGDGTRRRRRRGGRGRGRGRGRGDGESAEALAPSNGAGIEQLERDIEDEELEDVAAAPRAPRSTPFGSVWDSQLGTAAPAASSGTFKPIADDEDFDEPEIPEYLIAEQRRGASGRSGGGGGARGGRAAYQSAIARERYGRGGGGGGINRYPDVSGRTPAAGSRQDRSYDRGPRPSAGSGGGSPAPRRGSDEWSEVPPELEAQLMAQIASKPVASRPADVATDVAADALVQADAPKPKTTRKPASSRTTKSAASADAEAPKPKTTRKPAASKAATAAADPAIETADAAPKKRTTTRKPATASVADPADSADDAPAKKPRAPRKAPTA
jgi:uncharacterized LabA/DUF88 family protein